MQPTWSERDCSSFRWLWQVLLLASWWTSSQRGFIGLVRQLPLPQGLWCPLLESERLPLVQIYSQKGPIMPSLLWYWHPSRMRSWHSMWCPCRWTLLRPLLAPWEAQYSLLVYPRDLQSLAILPLQTGAFKHINLKVSGKEYACGKCGKTSSNQTLCFTTFRIIWVPV